MNEVIIDGAQGEGGGQVLRTSLTLAALTGQTIEVRNIRGGRKKPGLLRQHLTSVRAAAQICHAKVQGDQLRSDRIRFEPGQIQSGEYHFAIGTAGSTSLVCQTILPLLMVADGESVVHFEGGTHNGMSPSLTFLQQSFFPILAEMGVKYDIDVHQLGFFPAGGGKWTLHIVGNPVLKPFSLMAAPLPGKRRITGIVSNLSVKIIEREYAQVVKSLDWHDAILDRQTPRTQGPGNYLALHVFAQTHQSVVEGIGEQGVKAEHVAKRLSGKMKKFLASKAAVEEHLADQLLLMMLMVDGCEFITTELTLHSKTNMAVIEQLTNRQFACEHIENNRYLIQLKSN